MYNREIWMKIKPLMERYSVDLDFRNAVKEGRIEVFQDMVSPLDPVKAAQAVIDFRSGTAAADGKTNPYLQCICDYYGTIESEIQKRFQQLPYIDSRAARFHEMVTNRVRMESRLMRMHKNVHFLPIMFELGSGCSVRCAFCALDAPPLKYNYRYTEENASLFREILQVAKEKIGPVVGVGGCYFATEPMDNPDYEKFVQDFWEITGEVPQTTTAIPEREPERLRTFMKMLGQEEMKKASVRFSIRTMAQYEKIMQVYTPEELLDIEFLPNTPESDTAYSDSGRAHSLPAFSMAGRGAKPYSIVCLAGVKVNMAEGMMEWVQPEIPSEEFQNGYSSLGLRPFHDAASFREGLEYLLENCAVYDVRPGRRLSVNPNVKIRKEGNVLSFQGDGVVLRMGGNQVFQDGILRLLRGTVSFEGLCEDLGIRGFSAGDLESKLNYLLRKGYLRIW